MARELYLHEKVPSDGAVLVKTVDVPVCEHRSSRAASREIEFIEFKDVSSNFPLPMGGIPRYRRFVGKPLRDRLVPPSRRRSPQRRQFYVQNATS